MSRMNIHHSAFLSRIQPSLSLLARLTLCPRWHRDDKYGYSTLHSPSSAGSSHGPATPTSLNSDIWPSRPSSLSSSRRMSPSSSGSSSLPSPPISPTMSHESSHGHSNQQPVINSHAAAPASNAVPPTMPASSIPLIMELLTPIITAALSTPNANPLATAIHAALGNSLVNLLPQTTQHPGAQFSTVHAHSPEASRPLNSIFSYRYYTGDAQHPTNSIFANIIFLFI
jgi:hypothetical protein